MNENIKAKTVIILKFAGKIYYIKNQTIARMILRIEPQTCLTRTIIYNQ